MSQPTIFRLNPFAYLFRIMWAYAAGRHAQVVLFYILQILGNSLMLVQPFAIGMAINALQAGGPDALHEALLWLGAVAACNIVGWVFWGPARHIERLVAFCVYRRFMADMYRKLTELPLAWHQDHHSGSTINRIRTATEGLRDFSQDQYISLRTALRFVVASAMLLWISPPVGAVTLLAFLLLFVVILRFDKILVQLYQQYNDGAHQLNATFFDYVSNMTTLQILRLTALSAQSLAHAVERLRRPFVNEVVWNEIKWAVMDISVHLISVLTLAYYIISEYGANGAIALGSVFMIYQYQNNLTSVVSMVGVHYGTLIKQANSLEAIAPLLHDHATRGRPHSLQVEAPAFDELSLHDVNLTRSRVDGISFNLTIPHLVLKKGERVALIGASGGGKSTLLCMLAGIYDVSSGTLQLNGITQPISNLNDVATLVPQDPEIFENTIRFNITLGVTTDDAAIERAVMLAGFAPVLAQLPQGLETDIREKGVNLSVGQKQRLALARGLFAAAHASLILLDEPTSSIDLPTEEAFFKNLFQIYPEKTIVISMHRLHLLPLFDRIIYVEDGRIVAAGPPAELLQTAGPVRDLFQHYRAT